MVILWLVCMEKYSIFLLLALLSEIIGTVSGFGSSILFVPLASVFFDFKTVLAVTGVFHVFSNVAKIFLFRKGLDRNIVIRLGIPAVLFVIAGAWLTTVLPALQAKLFMDVSLIILALYMLRNFKKKLARTNTNLYIGGAVSGFLAGFTGTGGAVRGITLAAFQLPKDVFIMTSSVVDLGVDTSRTVIYLANGYLLRQAIGLLPFLVLVSILGSYIGKIILKHTSEALFRYIVLILIMAVSLFEIGSYISPGK